MSRAAAVLKAAFFCVPLVLLVPAPAPAQLFDNLRALGNRLRVTGIHDPQIYQGGPKGISAADLDGDLRPDLAVCNVDGSVSVYYGEGDGRFSPEEVLLTGSLTLRDIVIADLTADGRPDIAVTDPAQGRLVILTGEGGRSFALPRYETTWLHARNLEAGDFNGDGLTDLVLAGNGLGLREYHGTPEGGLRSVVDLPELDHPSLPGTYKPVYSLDAFRSPGASGDSLVATHAEYPGVHVLDEIPGEGLRLQGQVAVEPHIHYLRAGKLARPESEPGPLDLVVVLKELDRIQVRLGTQDAARFGPAIHQELLVPLGPRSVEILDLDGDGWNDIVVPVRNLDRVLTFRNDRGTLVTAHEMPVGSSPRESASADFNGDGSPDVAVINRGSSDISILPAYPDTPGFSVLDQVYLVDGDVAVLDLADMNSDGKDDVVQLHQAAGDVSIRLADAEGRLAAPRFYPMGTSPHSLALIDIDGDRGIDLVTASIEGSTPSVSLRLADGAGGFGALTTLQFSSRYPGGFLIGILAADFDRDGDADLAIGIYDCSGSHIVFFENTGGTFTETNRFGFRYAQALGTADFDLDGDLDFVAVSGIGELAVLESPGNLLTAQDFRQHIYTEMQEHNIRGTSMTVADLNSDGDPEILVTGSAGFIVYRGAPGMAFIPEPHFTPESIESAVSDAATADFDGDGDADIAVACRVAACISVLTQGPGMEYSLALSVDVPSARHLAAGDVDGDGFKDLVGSGNALWTALSSRRGRPGPPPVLDVGRERIAGVVINEILAINEDLPLAADEGKRADWVEIHNGGAAAATLSGWSLTLEAPDGSSSAYVFPSPAELAPGAHRLLIFSPTIRTEYHTGFRLPGEGGRLILQDAALATVDSVSYARQFEDVSYARYADALPAFTFNPRPTPGSTNEYAGSMPPQFDLIYMTPAAPAPGEPVEFLGRGRDDVGIVDVTLVYRLADGGPAPAARVELYDISFGLLAETGERTFLGRLERGLPGGPVDLHIEVTDRSGNQTEVPDGGSGLDEDGDEGPFRIQVGVSPETLPPLEISEVVSLNVNGLEDNQGGNPDWVEVRNCSPFPVDLSGAFLANRFPAEDTEDWYEFPAGVLPPGGFILVLCDGNTDEGPDHAPFSLDAEGDRVVLAWRSEANGGAHVAIDEIAFGPMAPDTALARAECGGEWTTGNTPTPGTSGPGGPFARGDVNASGILDISDPIGILGHLFLGTIIECPQAANVNGDLAEDITDAIHILNYLFQGGTAPQGEPVPAEECLAGG